jgi:hypothetical protein
VKRAKVRIEAVKKPIKKHAARHVFVRITGKGLGHRSSRRTSKSLSSKSVLVLLLDPGAAIQLIAPMYISFLAPSRPALPFPECPAFLSFLSYLSLYLSPEQRRIDLNELEI